MMTLLHEIVLAFEDTWIDCLGDLARYRIATENEHAHNRDSWASVSPSWQKKIDSISLGFVLCTTQADTLPAWPWLTASTEHSQNKTTADPLPCDGSRA